MRRMTAHITIGDMRLRGITSFECYSTFDQLTDTATIEVPRKIKYNGKRFYIGMSDQALIKREQPVRVELGYDDNNTSIFEGYVVSVANQVPVTIEVQDAMLLL